MHPGQRAPKRRSTVRTAFLGLICLCSLVASPLRAAPGIWELGQPARRVFIEARDLPHSTVHSLLVAQDGRLWIGTQDGAAVYDGTDWTIVDLPTRSLSNFVRTIAQTSDGALWFGTQSAGLARYADESWSVFAPASDGLPDDRINVLLERTTGAGSELWIGTHDGGLTRWRGGQFERFGAASGLPSERIWDLFEKVDGEARELWVATGRGVARWIDSEGRFEAVTAGPSESASSLAQRRGPDGASELWVGTYGDGVHRLVAGVWERVPSETIDRYPFVTDLAPAIEEDAIWVSTDGGGVLRWEDRGEERLALGEALSSGAVYKLLETKPEQGGRAVWLGTRNQGLIRVKRGYWRAYSPVDEVPRIAVTALGLERLRGGGEAIWLGTDGGGALRFAQGRWESFSVASGALGHDSVLAFATLGLPNGGEEVWVGTRNGGLSRWDGSRWYRYDAASGALANDLVQALLVETRTDGGKILWVGTRDGLATWTDGIWDRTPAGPDGPRGSVVALARTTQSGSSELWVGTTDGLYRRTRSGWRHYGVADGLRNPTVHALFPSRTAAGRPILWLGTDGGGIYRISLDEPEALPQSMGELVDQRVPSDVVYAFTQDAHGRLYFSTNRGVVRLTAGSSGYSAEVFESYHGLPSGEGNRGAAMTDGAGRIWFGTARGAAAFDPDNEVFDDTGKRLLLSGEALYGGQGRFTTGARLPSGTGRVLFAYRLLSFFGEERTRYRTRLEGLEAAFGDWTPAIEREFSSLAPGAYRFEVIGRDASGNLSGPVGLAFEVAPAFWQTGWARSGIALVLLAAIVGIWRARTATLRRRERYLQDLVAARTRQLEGANALLIDLSYLDPLTSIPNRRRFDELLAEEWRRAGRARSQISLIMIDVDAFKAFNDSYGHQEGDQCLRRVATTLSDLLPRAGDSVARYGGEEFAVLLPGTDAAGAYLLAERLRLQVARLAIPHRASAAAAHVTVSCGIATRRPLGDEEPAALVAAADAALYAAKRAGRNRSILDE